MATAAVQVGAQVAKLLASLFQGHAIRTKQAKDENSATNIGVQGFDSDLALIVQYFNSGQIDANGAIQAAQQSYNNFWALVTPHIQPGRNGCNGGAGCGANVGGPPGKGGCTSGQVTCSGSIGAACCVGCNDIKGSWANVIYALQRGGGTVNICAVDGSKYGGQSRAGYTVTFQQSTTVQGTLQGAINSAINDLGLSSDTGLNVTTSNTTPQGISAALGLGTNPVTGRTQVTSTFVLIVLGAIGVWAALRPRA